MLTSKRSDATSYDDDEALDSVGRIWLHSSFLYLGLPPYEVLQDIWHPGKFNKNNTAGTSTPKANCYRELVDKVDHQRRLVVSHRWYDVDFKNKAIRNLYRKSEFLLVSVFDVLE